MLKRRIRRYKGTNYIKWLIFSLIMIIGIPTLLVRGCTLPFIRTQEVPMINVWRTDRNELVKMTLEEYVKGVVAAEMPASFELEALKAQAVAARTYAYRRIATNQRIPDHPEAHLSTDYRVGQAWISWEKLQERWGLVGYYVNKNKISKAVEETSGLILTYDNNPILAVYHSTSGGRTENSEHYWSSALPYLRSVNDPYGKHSPFLFSESLFTKTQISTQMEVESLDTISIIERYPSGRVKVVEVGDKWVSGREIRERLGLRSTWFTLEVINNTVKFSVWGYGHGVGLSQYGADGMAKEGYDYTEILKYYYQGINLQKLY